MSSQNLSLNSIAITNLPATQPVSGSVTAFQGGVWSVGRTWTLLNTTDSVNSVQSGIWNINDISGTISLPTGASTSANQTNNSQTTQIVNSSGSAAVVKTLNAGPIGTDNALVTASAIYGLTTGGGGGYVEVKVTPSGSVSTALGDISGIVGQQPMASSIPVVIASNQSAIPVTQSGTWTTGRTWSLLNSTDSVNVGNFPSTFGVTQSTSPWVVSGTVAATQSGNWSVRTQDGSGNNLTSQVNGSQRALDVGIDVAGVQVDPRAIRTLTSSDTVTAVQPTGSNLHVVVDTAPTTSVTQGTSPWVSNITQFGGNNVVTGTGASGVGIPRVTVSNDSNVLATQSGTWTTGRTWSLLNTTDSVNAVQSGTWTTGRTWSLSSGSDSIAAVQSGTWTVQQGTPPWSVVGNVASGASDSGNPLKVGAIFNSTLPTVTTGQRVDNQADANGRLIVNSTPVDGAKATYSAAVANLATALLATDIFTITGSNTKTIRILRLGISGLSSSTGNFAFFIIKRSAANTGGTSTTLTDVPHDSSDAGGTATVLAYTANPSALGAAVGTVRTIRISFGANNVITNQTEVDFGNGPDKAIILRGTSQLLAINLNGVTIAGASIDLYVEWTEE